MDFQPSREAFSLQPLLSQLWLHEPDAETIARAASELGLPAASTTDLASAYTDVFLLNVYPYGTAFTDPAGELNGPAAQQIAAVYAAHGFCPPELNSVGAPDHLGLCLGFWAYLEKKGLGSREFASELLEWVPVGCLAVEREPSAQPFYRALANKTRELLLSQCVQPPTPLRFAPGVRVFDHQLPFTNGPLNEEVRLRDIIQFFLAPAQCGVFLSRSRWGQIAKELGMRLPFGSRFEVAEMFFASAGGEAETFKQRLNALEAEVEAWATAYQGWAEQYPAWQPIADGWLARTAVAIRTLVEMRQMAAAGPQSNHAADVG